MSMSEQLQQQWLMHRTVLQEVLKRVPDDKIDFKPWEGSMTLGELALHMATASDWFVEAIQSGKLSRPASQSGPKTADEVRRTVDEYTDKTSKSIASLTDEQLNRIVEAKHIMGFDAPGKTFFFSMKDHEVHHKGQMFVYARMAGVQDMPFFMNTSR